MLTDHSLSESIGDWLGRAIILVTKFWPGNVRDLSIRVVPVESVVESIRFVVVVVVAADEPVILPV